MKLALVIMNQDPIGGPIALNITYYTLAREE